MPVPSSLNLQPEANDKAKETTPEETSRPSSPASPDSPRSTTTGGEDLPHNKLFVGGLSSDTTEEKLKEFFSEYGEILDCSLKKDSEYQRSRGFAFIKFTDPESVQNIIEAHSKEPLKIDNKLIDPKYAVPRRGNKVRRIFVGGLSSETDEEDMRQFFETFGAVEEVQLMYDRNTNRHRGFGFITFERPGPAEKVCGIQFHDIKGKKVEVKVAQTKEALALQAGKARSTSYSQGGYGIQRGHASYNNYSPTYPPFYPGPPHYPIEVYSPHFMLNSSGGKPRGGGVGGGANKMRLASQFSPPFFSGYSNFSPSEHNGGPITSPQYFTAGFGSLPSPFFMRPDPALPLSSPPVDFIEQFQAMTMMGNPYTGMASGSPPNGLPINNSTFTYQNGGETTTTMGTTNYSPPSAVSPKGGSPTSTPVNGYSQVPSNFTPGKSSYPTSMQQQTPA